MHSVFLFKTNNWTFIDREHCHEPTKLMFSPDGSKLIVNSWDGTVTVIDTEKMEKIQEEKKARCAAVSWKDNSEEIILDGNGNLRRVNSEEIILSVPFR